MNFVKLSLKYPQVTVTILLLAFIAGVYALIEMPRREDPKIDIRQAQIIAFYPGANSLQVEEQVTRKLERALFQNEEVRKEKTYSTTADGAVIINVWLNSKVKGTDVFWNKLRHQLLMMKAVELPDGVYGPFVNSDYSDTEVLVIGIEMDHPDHAQLREYIQKLEDGLRTIEAVSKIKRIGEQKEQILITTNSAKLSQYGISLAQVMQILRSQNTISPTGDLKTPDTKVRLYAKGYYKTERDIAGQIIGTSQTGEVVRLQDVATIERQYQEPDSKVMVNGRYTMFVAVQMHEGFNIVQFGKTVEKKLAEITKQLPGNVKLVTVVSQPKIVENSISHFLSEFFLAIVAVIIVILLLLPFRVAAVAAMAIPMSIAVTLCLMNATGIELHQVSLAGLIVVLGMVVDNAVVIADNYVDLLDHGVDRHTAAWRCATELTVPVLTATITIIAAFLPLAFLLTGTVREFIIALPYTVSIALAASFIVSMVLTPLLCFIFIKKGLHDHAAAAWETKKKFSLLDTMQTGYNKAIIWCMAHSKLVIIGSLSTILFAFALLMVIPQQFFPVAERNQFLVELSLPTGTKLEKTESSIVKLQDMFKDDKRVTSYSTFVGFSAPRFYYNFIPEIPSSNFAQILVNTHDNKEAQQLRDELSTKANSVVPEGIIQVKLLQQGAPTTAPIEIRIVGDNINTLKSIGEQVRQIIRKTNKSQFVRSDFREDYYGVNIQLKDDAYRLGFTTEIVAKSVYAGFAGAPVSIIYEGNAPVDIMLRLDKEDRRNFGDLNNMYLASPVTGASVPLRQIAALESSWHTGRLMHRNGLRTLTIQSEPVKGVLSSQLLNDLMPHIDKLSLPVGYHIEYGGEYENQNETFSEMAMALAVSLLLIFLVLLLQFRNLKEALIVMLTIPLSLFGAMLGLIITHNPFGFMAFVGLLSLAGIVTRNAIILIDYTNVLLHQGIDISTAALEAGKRRLRPIFLTASAAAIGVIPMILSGSPMWSPLAAVIAVGIMFAMVISLLLVPVLYAHVIKPSDKKITIAPGTDRATTCVKTGLVSMIVVVGLLLSAPNLYAQQVAEKLNLEKVIDLALQNNNLLNIKKLQVAEKQQKVNEDKVKLFPVVMVGGKYEHDSDLPGLNLEKGSFGQFTSGSISLIFPAADASFPMANHSTYIAGAGIYQPISQIPKIWTGVQIAKTDLQIAETEQAKTSLQIKQAAEKLYFGLLIVQKQKEEAAIKLGLAQTKLYDVAGAVRAGKTTESNKIGLLASVMQEEQNLLKLNIQYDDYLADLKHLTGLLASTMVALELISINNSTMEVTPVDAFIQDRVSNNNDLKIAALNKTKADYAIQASKYGYLPDFGIHGGYTYQEGNLVNPTSNAFIGASLIWNIQDAFSNSFVNKQRVYIKKQAQENLENTLKQVNKDVEKSRRNLTQSMKLIALSKKVVDFRREDLKIQTDKSYTGLNLESDFLTAKAALAKAESDYYAAHLNYRIALTDLKILTGRY